VPIQSPKPSSNLLVIGYGNELRCDDGVGLKVVAALEQLNLPGVSTIACHQLTPELAEPVSQAQRVIFVDATMDVASGVGLRELKPSESSQRMAHAADPRTLLALARDVFGRFPAAWWLTIPIEKIEFGSELSPLALRGFQLAVEKIQSLANIP
jgi:hydrogenase maturation protease